MTAKNGQRKNLPGGRCGGFGRRDPQKMERRFFAAFASEDR